MITDLGAVVDLLVTDVVTVRRPAPDTYDADGRALPRVFASTSARVCLQPIGGAELRRLAPGTDTQNLVSLWSRSELRTGDIVTLASREYEVESSESWATLGNYYKAMARERGPSEARP